MTDKTIKIIANIEANTESAQRKIDALNRSSQSSQNNMSQNTQNSFNQASGNKTVNQKVTEMKRVQDLESKFLKEKNLELKKIIKSELIIDKNQRKRIMGMKQEIRSIQEVQRERQKVINNMGGGSGGGSIPTRPTGGGFFGKMSGMRGLGIASAIGGFGLKAAANLLQYSATGETEPLANVSSSISNTIGREYGESVSGKGMQYNYNRQLRSKAFDIAKKKRKKDEFGHFSKALLSAASVVAGTGIVAAGAYLTAGTGGLASPLAVPMMQVGGAMAAGGAYGLMSSNKTMSKIGSMFGIKSAKDRFNASMDSGMFKDMRVAEENLKKQEPRKQEALRFYSKYGKRFLGQQRALNLSDSDMYSGEDSLIGRNTRQGFSVDTTLSNMNQLTQSGASSAMIKNVDASSRLQRDYGITNASSLLGRISATGADPSQSQEAVKRLMTAAVKNGVNTSNMTTETRKLAQTLANVNYQTGGSAIMRNLTTAAAGDLSMRNIDQSRGVMKQVSDAFGGNGDNISLRQKYTYMSKNKKKFNKLSESSKLLLPKLKLEDMSENNMIIQRMAQEMGESPKEFIQRAMPVITTGLSYTGKAEGSIKKLSGLLKDSGVSVSDFASGKYKDKVDDKTYKEIVDASGSALTTLANEKNNIIGTTKQKSFLIASMKALNNENLTDDNKAALATSKSQDTIANKEEMGNAKANLESVKAVGDFGVNLRKATSDMQKFSGEYAKSIGGFNTSIDGASKAVGKFVETLTEGSKVIKQSLGGN